MAGLHVGDEPAVRGVVQRRGHLTLVRERRGAALLGEQVNGERRVAACGEAPGHRTDVVGEAAVLVHDQDRAVRLVGGRPGALHLAAVGTGERDCLGRQRRWTGWA